MNYISITNISYKEKKALVTALCLMYKKYRGMHSFLTTKNSLQSQSSLNDVVADNAARKIVNNLSIFETILNLLGRDQSLVIQNEFIDTPESSLWYEDHWSKSTYYKLKHDAIDHFLFLFYA